MAMTVGVRVPCYRRWCTAVEVRAIAQQAEDLGFGSLWVQDHLVAPLRTAEETAVQGVDDWMRGDMPPASTRAPTTLFQYCAGDDWWLDPYVTWGFLAAATTRVRLASDIIVVPYRNPIVQAESEALGVDFDARGRIHDEYLRIIRTLLASEEAAFEGEFFRFGPVRTLIRPVQQPCPTSRCTSTRSRRSRARCYPR